VLHEARALGDVAVGVNVHAATLAVDTGFLGFLGTCSGDGSGPSGWS
jgi:hypothetical protein